MKSAIKTLTDKGAYTWWDTPISIAKFLQEDILDKALDPEKEKEKLAEAMFEEYTKNIHDAQSISALEKLIEEMAYNETITNDQYCDLVNMALRRIDAGILKSAHTYRFEKGEKQNETV